MVTSHATSEDVGDDRRWWVLGVLCLSLTVISIDNTILNVALPSIVESLNAKGSELQLLIDGYTIVFACLLLTAGSLGDKLGRKGILTIGLAAFGTFSALAAFSTSSHMLIGARALMGIGGACIYPSTLSILTNTFHDPRERARARRIWHGARGPSRAESGRACPASASPSARSPAACSSSTSGGAPSSS